MTDYQMNTLVTANFNNLSFSNEFQEKFHEMEAKTDTLLLVVAHLIGENDIKLDGSEIFNVEIKSLQNQNAVRQIMIPASLIPYTRLEYTTHMESFVKTLFKHAINVTKEEVSEEAKLFLKQQPRYNEVEIEVLNHYGESLRKHALSLVKEKE